MSIFGSILNSSKETDCLWKERSGELLNLTVRSSVQEQNLEAQGRASPLAIRVS